MTGFMPQKFVFDLSTAGYQDIDMAGGVLRFINCEDASGALNLSAKVAARIGQADAVSLTMRLNNAIMGRSRRHVRLSWDAQSGLVATFLLSPDMSEFDMDADPPAQLVQSSSGASMDDGADITISSGGGSDQIAAAASRTELHLYADGELRMGPNAGAARGMIIPANTPVVLETAAEVNLYNPGGSDVVVSYAEVKT